jgi:ATP-dependent RNA helicase RhlE
MEHTPQTSGFDNLGLAPKIVDILIQNKFTQPTPIQAKSIPVALEGKDMVGIAQTGTGKTLAFGLPMIQRLSQLKGQGLVLVPTRELALQVEETLRKIGNSFGLKTAVVIGGASMHMQINELRRKPHIIVATPGRLADHLEQKTVTLERIQVVVLDEADRMFDIGFAPQIKRILSLTPKERQTLLFSATMPAEIAKMAAQHMKLPLRIEVAPQGTSSANVEQEIFIISKEQKLQLLQKMLDDNKGTVLVFSRTKFGAKRIAASLRHMKHTAVEIHSNRTLAQRKAALAGFKSGQYRILVATDIAARGIDVTGISLVINFDLPDNSEDYVHRIGRTGRAGMSGKAVSFVTHQEKSQIRQIERLIKKSLPIIGLPTLPPRIEIPREENGPERGYGRPYRGGQGGGQGREERNFGGGGNNSQRRNRTHRYGNNRPRPEGERGGSSGERPAYNRGPRTEGQGSSDGSQQRSFQRTFRRPTRPQSTQN